MDKAVEAVDDFIRAAAGKNHAATENFILPLSSLDLEALPPNLSRVQYVRKLYLDYNDLEVIPSAMLRSIKGLTLLSLIGNQLQALPDTVECLTELEELYLNENYLEGFPTNITRLKRLKLLNFVGNEVQHLPADIQELCSLERIDADENVLDALPSTFGLLSMLTVAELANNKITTLPSNFGCLSKLSVLNLSCNNIRTLPESFSTLPNLAELDLSTNKLKTLPDRLDSCAKLRRFYVESNMLEVLPDWVGNMPHITEFSVKDNHLKDKAVPESFGKTSANLRLLLIAGNFIRTLPESIGGLAKLEKLHMGSVIVELERRNFQNGNWVSRLPDSFGYLRHLKKLHMDENQLTELPDSFGDLASLEWMDVGQNQLHRLPESFGNLHRLKVCLLAQNHLETLPSNFGNLAALEELRLDHNHLTELPKSFSGLTELKVLDLFNNCLKELPPALTYLTKITRMDIDENDFGVNYLKVPHIQFRATYAPRDSTKQDNWRGRARQDLVNVEITQVKRAEPADEDESVTDEEEAADDKKYNYNALRNAVSRNMSLWRSHSGPSVRQKQTTTAATRGGIRTQDTQSCASDDEFWGCEDLLSGPPSGHDGESSITRPASVPQLVHCTEDWDAELDQIPLGSCPSQVSPKSSQCAIEKLHHFVPAETHVEAIVRAQLRHWVKLEDGQFDDFEPPQLAEQCVAGAQSGEHLLVLAPIGNTQPS